MTYLAKRVRARRGAVRQRPALSGGFDDFLDGMLGGVFGNLSKPALVTAQPTADTSSSSNVFADILNIPPVIAQDIFDAAGGTATSVCVDQANAQQAQFDANTMNLAANWQPSGFYSPDQLSQIVTQVMGLVGQAQADLTNAMGSFNGAPDALTNAMDNLNRQATGTGVAGVLGTNGQQYLATVAQAKATNANVIDAADLKFWVVNTLTTVSNAYVAIYVLNCQTPFWISILAKVVAAFAAVVNFVMGVLGVLVKIGDAILSAPSALSQLGGIATWVGLGWLAWWGYNKYKARAR